MTIDVKIIADSISPQGVRLTTFELEYPRFIHAELMTHRMFSRNAQSSRAVPVSKSLELEYVEPIIYGKNQPGMSSYEVMDEEAKREAQYYWHALVRYCRDFSERMSKAGLHKQWANRPLEWHSNIKVVVTATEWDNFFWLRIDPDAAQPEIVTLAIRMKHAMAASTPVSLKPGEWHLPYIATTFTDEGVDYFVVQDSSEYGEYYEHVTLDVAKKISASCCAQVSYRKLDTSVEKALEIYEKLFSGAKPHLSPVEHQATPMNGSSAWGESIDYPGQSEFISPYGWGKGITHCDRNGNLWSGNLRGWTQYRQLLEKEYHESKTDC